MSEDNAVLPPKSYQIWALIGLFGFSNYLLRTVLGYVAVAMDHEATERGSGGGDNTKAIILSSFFIGYASNNVLSGMAASRFGGMTVLNFSCVGWSVCGMAIPSVFDMSGGGATSVGLMMFLLGMCCAPMFPASQAVLSFFSTPSTISLGASLRAAGTHTGSIMATFATPLLLGSVGWRALLQLYGSLGLGVVLVTMLCGPAGGNQAKRSEHAVLERAAGKGELQASTAAPPTASATSSSFLHSAEFLLLSDSSLQSAYLTHMAANLANFNLLSYMPSYFVDVLHVDLALTAPYLAPSRFSMLLGVVCCGYASKYVLNHELLTLTQTRRGGACVSLVGVAMALLALPLLQTPFSASLCLSLATFCIGCFEVCLQSTYIDLCADSPQYAGFLCGCGNTLGAFPGALGPFLVSQILGVFHSWVLVFWVMSLCLVVAAGCHSQYGNTTSIPLGKCAKV